MSAKFFAGAFFVLIALTPWVPLYLAVMTYITPKPLLDRYFKKPHFNAGELIFYNSFPISLMRGIVFCGACVIPRYWTGRQMPDYLEHVPRWFCRASKVLIYGMFIHFGLVVFLMIGLLLHMELSG